MSKYSELMGSFIRTGPYPLEANYIFPTEDDLKKFYSEELRATTLHRGLLKIVKNDGEGNQVLYWVTRNKLTQELEFQKLISAVDLDSIFEQLEDLSKKLELEIKIRREADDKIWGTQTPDNIPDDLDSILDLANAVTEIREQASTLKKELQATVGTDEDDIIAYLQTLPYKSLTEVANALHKFLNTYDEEDSKINTLPELQDFLEGFTDKDKLKWLFQDWYDKIMGDPYPTEKFRTLRGIEDFVRWLRSVSENTDANLQKELDLTQVGVGLNQDGTYSPDKETYYLQDATSVMNALKILDSLINKAINNYNLQPGETDSVKISIVREETKTTIYGDVKLHTDPTNDIQIIQDEGLYHNVDSTYENGILTIYVNGQVRKQHVLGLSSIVEDAKYDPTTEEIVIIFKLLDGTNSTVRIPVDELIREWVVDNSLPGKVVELTKEEIRGGGPDKLSADVRLSTNKYNILKKDGNTLLVKGTADNIVFEGGLSVQEKINQLEQTDNTQQGLIESLREDLQSEITRAEKKEHEIEDDYNKKISDEYNRAIQAEHELSDLIESEKTRAEQAEQELQNNLDKAIESEKNRAELEEQKIRDEFNKGLETEKNRAELVEQDLQNQITNEVNRAMEAESVLKERLTELESHSGDSDEKISELDEKLKEEVNRAKQAEHELQDQHNALSTRVDGIDSDLQDFKNLTNEELAKKLESVQLIKNDDLSYTILVDGISIGVINIPKDQFLESVTLDNTVLHFLFSTTNGPAETHIDLSGIIKDALEGAVGDLEGVQGLLNETVQRLNEEIIRATHREDLIEQTLNSVKETTESNKTSIESIKEDILNIKLKDNEQDLSIKELDNKLTSVETNIRDNINAQIENITDKLNAEIARSTEADTRHTNDIADVNLAINNESVRAQAKESALETKIDTNNQLITEKADNIQKNLEKFQDETKEALGKKIESVELEKHDDLTYILRVDGSSIGTINIPEDDYLHSVELIGTVLHFVYGTNSNTISKNIDLSGIIEAAISQMKVDITSLQEQVTQLFRDLAEEVSRAQLAEETLHDEIERERDRATQKEDFIWDELHHHINDFNNPHHVTFEQLGFTENIDCQLPVVISFIDLIGDLPKNPANGDKYILRTQSATTGIYQYELFEWDAVNQMWQRKVLEIGTVASVIDENAWKLNSDGIERVLDASDYKYFYNKIYDETKDLIEDIDWEDPIETDGQNGQIRLKITYKKKYGNPDSEGTNEVTNPYKNHDVKYIDIEKARFLSSAYSRPANQSDIDNGYASSLGEPMLILVFTTGDYVAIRLNELMNIYDPVDTDSIDMEVTDWTGDKDKSYKIKADVNIATTKQQSNAISLHINNTNNDKGLYGILHTSSTPSIALNPSSGESGQKYLTANLVIDNAKNSSSDVLLTIGQNGLSAKVIWGDYYTEDNYEEDYI